MKKQQKPRKNPECDEGIAARKKFEQTMKDLFQVPKAEAKKPEKGKD